MWQDQKNNIGNSIKLVVFFSDDQPEKSKTFHAFKSEEKTGKAIQNMRRRILGRLVFGKYKTAIFYQDGLEVEKWVNGIKV
jgi:hypothetical protein